MKFSACLVCLLMVWATPNAAMRTKAGEPTHHHVEPGCQVREEETFFLGTTGETLQNQLYIQSEKCNDTITTLEGWNNDTSSSRYACPWKHVLVSNPCRSPSVTLEVRCLPGANTSQSAGSHRSSSTCHEVYFYRWIQARHQHVEGWTWKLYPVPVACTAVRNRVIRLQAVKVTHIGETSHRRAKRHRHSRFSSSTH